MSENVVRLEWHVLHDHLAAASTLRGTASATEALFAAAVGAVASTSLGRTRAFLGVVTAVSASAVAASAGFFVACARTTAADAGLVVTVAVFLARSANLASARGASTSLGMAGAGAIATSAGLSVAGTGFFMDSTVVTKAALASAELTVASAGVASTVALLQVAQTILLVESTVTAGALMAIALSAVTVAGFASAGTRAADVTLVANHFLLHHLHGDPRIFSSHATHLTSTVETVALTKSGSTIGTLSVVAATCCFRDSTRLAAACAAVAVHTVTVARLRGAHTSLSVGAAVVALAADARAVL